MTGDTGLTLQSFGLINDVVATSLGGVYVLNPFGVVTIPENQAISPDSTSTLASTYVNNTPGYYAQMGFLNQMVFIASGLSTVAVMSTNAITANSTFQMGILQPSTYPPFSTSTVAPVPTLCSLCDIWRGRLVLAMDANNPQNFYMSRVGVPQDWNYAALDDAAAVAGNLSEAGQIGEPITAIIPFSDDVMFISTVNEIWMINGDLAQGGTITIMQRGGGIITSSAWTIDNDGNVYYITSAGLYRVLPIWAIYRPPELISGTEWSYWFETLDPTSQNVSMEWDTTNKYLRIFVSSPLIATTTTTKGQELIWDSRNNGFWLQQYGYTETELYMGPAATATYFSGIGPPASQITLLGDWYGNVLFEDIGSSTIADMPFQAAYQPFKLAPVGQSLLQKVDITLGEWPSSLAFYTSSGTSSTAAFCGTVVIQAGPTAADVSDYVYPATLAPASSSTFASQNIQYAAFALSTDRRQVTYYPRLSGEWFSIQVLGPTNECGINALPVYLSVEQIQVTGIPFGFNRVQR